MLRKLKAFVKKLFRREMRAQAFRAEIALAPAAQDARRAKVTADERQEVVVTSKALEEVCRQAGSNEGGREGNEREDNKAEIARSDNTTVEEQARSDKLHVKLSFEQISGTEPRMLEDEYRRGAESVEDREDENAEEESTEGKAARDEHEESDESDKYDWEAEAKKPAKDRGVQSTGWYGSLVRYRRMVWEQRDGYWRGRWRWTKWEAPESVLESRLESLRTQAICAWDVSGAPQEVLLLVIESLVGRRPPAREIHVADLPWATDVSNIALVCRSWYTLVAPALYSTLEVRNEVPRSPLRPSVAQYARRITIVADRPHAMSDTISRSNPRPSLAEQLVWRGHDSAEARRAPYHPSHAPIYTQIHRSYPHLLRLYLSRCAFLSSSDLLRLLTSFPLLQQVHLMNVSVANVSDSVIRRARPSSRPIRLIEANDQCRPSWLPFVTHCWTWPCYPSDHRVPPFHGLLPVEQQLVARISVLVAPSGISDYYILDAMDSIGETWVVSVRAITTHSIEFHARQDVSKPSGAARIHHCLARVQDSYYAKALMEALAEIGPLLAGLMSLETIVLETGGELTDDEIQKLLDSLRETGEVEVRHRTCDEAHKLALQAKKSPSCSTSADLELLSPFWCLQDYAVLWDFCLSHEYLATLSNDDKQGWAPTQPRGTPVSTND